MPRPISSLVGSQQLVDGLDHVHGYADGPGLVGDGPGYGLANPPCRVCAELVAFAVVELFDGAYQADVAFLNKVEQGQAAPDVLLGDAHHQAQVRFGQVPLGGYSKVFDSGEVCSKDELEWIELSREIQLVHLRLELDQRDVLSHDLHDLGRKQAAVEG